MLPKAQLISVLTSLPAQPPGPASGEGMTAPHSAFAGSHGSPLPAVARGSREFSLSHGCGPEDAQPQADGCQARGCGFGMGGAPQRTQAACPRASPRLTSLHVSSPWAPVSAGDRLMGGGSLVREGEAPSRAVWTPQASGLCSSHQGSAAQHPPPNPTPAALPLPQGS